MPSIDARRMMADLRRLATFGEYRTGVHRPTYSPQDVAARYWLAERMQDAGLGAGPLTAGEDEATTISAAQEVQA